MIISAGILYNLTQCRTGTILSFVYGIMTKIVFPCFFPECPNRLVLKTKQEQANLVRVVVAE